MDRTFLPGYDVLLAAILPFYFLVTTESWIWKEKKPIAYINDTAIEKGYVALGIYDPEGKKITITFNRDRTLRFSANSTADLVQVANGMAKTEVGLNTLKSMDASNIKISLEIDTVNVVFRSDENISAAETYPIISTPINKYGKPMGSKYISKAKIVIYKAAIKELIAKNKGKISINGVIIDTRYFSVSDIMASCTIHEFMHVLDRKSSGALNPMATKIQIEKKPYEVQLQYFKELEEQKEVK